MTGAEYLPTGVLTTLWTELDAALRDELVTSKRPLQEFLKPRHGVGLIIFSADFARFPLGTINSSSRYYREMGEKREGFRHQHTAP